LAYHPLAYLASSASSYCIIRDFAFASSFTASFSFDPSRMVIPYFSSCRDSGAEFLGHANSHKLFHSYTNFLFFGWSKPPSSKLRQILYF
jgi:hypothetical protein